LNECQYRNLLGLAVLEKCSLVLVSESPPRLNSDESLYQQQSQSLSRNGERSMIRVQALSNLGHSVGKIRCNHRQSVFCLTVGNSIFHLQRTAVASLQVGLGCRYRGSAACGIGHRQVHAVNTSAYGGDIDRRHWWSRDFVAIDDCCLKCAPIALCIIL
jgi:hypothetical protein